MNKRIFSRLFLPLLLAGILGHASPLVAQVRLETVTVLADDQEAFDLLGYFAPLMLTWSFENPPPAGAQVQFQRYSYEDGILLPIRTVSLDEFSGNYMWGDEEALPTLRSERYALVLVDENGFVILEFAMSDIHGTIFLREEDEGADFDPCSRTIIWRWDDYIYNDSEGDGETSLPPFLKYNQLMVLQPGESEEVVAYTSEMIEESLEMREAPYVFDHGPGPYYFRVRAVENPDGSGRVSYSNRRGITFDSPVIDDPEIVTVDVVDNQYIELGINLQGSVGDFTYEVLRSDQADQGFEVVGTLDAAVPGLHAFSDMAVPNLQQGMWYFRVEARIRDADCEDPAYESSESSSLFLAGEVIAPTTDQLEVSLSWEQNPGWDEFSLERLLPGGGGWEVVDVSTGLPGYYTDDLSPIMEGLAGEVRYRVIGIMGGEQVRSNEYLVVVEPTVFVPNVFNPSAVQPENRVFKPDFSGLTPIAMRLRIYNRWGQEVYAITDPEVGWSGWDGTMTDGQEAPEGMYAYTLEYQFPGSPDTEKRGSLLLLR
jgi:hypothetical protein